MTNRKRMGRALAAGMVLAGAVAGQIATTTTASAQPPGDCHKSWTNSSGEVICLSAPEWRVVIVCVHAGTPYTLDGPWAFHGGISTQSCSVGDRLQNSSSPNETVSYELSND